MPAFPPIPLYPRALDSDRTLYKVYNSSQTTLSADNNAYSDLIDVAPQDRDMWAENGFLNLSGELLYYDGVDRDGSGRVIRFKRCLRGINGFSNFNAAGTYVRGFVVADHHNQMALATILTEKFIGYNFDPDETTLDWRIRNLNSAARIADDFSCPEVQFDFQTVSQSASAGTTISYSVTVNGTFGSAVVSFGDGTTTTALSGTHTYSVNSKIDPVVTVTNGNCQIVQTPIERDEVTVPTPAAAIPPFTVPVPLTPAFPSLVFPSFAFPSIDIMPPPFVDSCLDLSPLNALSNISFIGGFNLSAISLFIPSLDANVNVHLSLDIPDGISLIAPTEISLATPSALAVSFTSTPTIDFGPVPADLPSTITFSGAPDLPSTITFANDPNLPSTITFVNNPTITSEISITYAPGVSIPNTINVNYGGGIPTVISVTPPASFPAITFGPAPMISVNWGTPPSITCTCTVVCPGGTSAAMAMGVNSMRGMAGVDYQPLANDIAVEYDLAGLPSVISIIPPNRPIRVENDIPTVIKLEVPDRLPDIRITGPEVPLPNEIKILAPTREEMTVSLVAPKVIELRPVGLPDSIPVVFPETIPMLSFDRSTFPDHIKVTGFPDVVRVEHNIPSRIEVDWSEAARTFSLPPVEVKPIEVKLDFNFGGLAQKISNDYKIQCFGLVPCQNL